jgi:hypothetical protein
LYGIPEDIIEYANYNIPYPVAVIGCRSTKPEMSLDCCEYDLAIFDGGFTNSRILKIGKHEIELINLPIDPKQNILALQNMVLLRNEDQFILSSMIEAINPQIYRRILTAFGKKAIIRSLFHYERINKTLQKQPVLSAMWLKISAYDFLEGVLALSGSRPMPLHELNQIREIVIERRDIGDGIKVALECIGLERASRSTISRALEGTAELNSKEYDKELTFTKIKHLLKKGMMSDCYYYIGKIGRRNLLAKSEKFYGQYTKLIQISMDLTNDVQQIQRMHRCLLNASRNTLKNY